MNNQTSSNPQSFIRYVNIYINLFYLIFGNLGNLLKIVFFLQKPLRAVPCTVYVLGSTLLDFLTLNNLPVLQLLVHLYPHYHWIKVTVDWSNDRNETILLQYPVSNHDVFMCKLRTYLHMFSTDFSFQLLVFASINRFCSTSRRQKRSERKSHFLITHFCDYPSIYKLCILSTIAWATVSIQHLFNFTIHSPTEGCTPQYPRLWTIWVASIHCFLLPILMIVFGLLSLRNIQHSSMSASRKRHSSDSRRALRCSDAKTPIPDQIDRQLTFMIVSEVFITVLTSLPYGAYAFHRLLHGLYAQTPVLTDRMQWIIIFIRMTMYLEASCGFYVYLITLSTLRKRFIKIFITKLIAVYIYCCHE